MPNSRLAVASHNYVNVSLLRKASTDAVPTTVSSATARILSTSLVEVASAINLTLKNGTTDQYVGTFPNTVSLTEGTEYVVEAVFVADDLTRTFRYPVIARSY